MDINAPLDTATEIALLARETDSPLHVVEKIYASERARLERSARIKTYVPVLTHRHVKERLRERQTAA
jgi:hypothetical protein